MSTTPATTAIRGNVLVVDDTLVNLRILAEMLAAHGYKVRPVTSGPQALQAGIAAPPDLVLLDINMPGMTGYEVCRQLKQHPATRDVPVIFMSARDEVLDKIFKAQIVSKQDAEAETQRLIAERARRRKLRDQQVARHPTADGEAPAAAAPARPAAGTMPMPTAGMPSVAGVSSRPVMTTTASGAPRPGGSAIARELAAAKDDDGDGDGLNRAQRRKLEAQKRKGGGGGKRPTAR